jgi:hypothetical protein
MPLRHGISVTGDQLTKSIKSREERLAAREKLVTTYSEMDEAALKLLLVDGEPLQREVTLDELINRGSPAAVAPTLECALSNRKAKWLYALESLPRQLVQEVIAERINTLLGTLLQRARLLANLIVDKLQRVMLERVLEDSSEDLRLLAV